MDPENYEYIPFDVAKLSANIVTDNKWQVPVKIQRNHANPLDQSTLFFSYQDALDYSNGKTIVMKHGNEELSVSNAYPGQFIAVIENNKTKGYIVKHAGGLLELGVASTADGLVEEFKDFKDGFEILSTNVNDISTHVEGIQSYLDTLSADENTEDSIANIKKLISDEVNARENGVTTVSNDLTAEVERAKAAEQVLSNAISTLNGDKTVEGSVDKKIDTAVKGILGDEIDEAYDTLKEIEIFLKANDVSAGNFISAINKLNDSTTAISSTLSSHLTAYTAKMTELDDGASALSGRMDAVEGDIAGLVSISADIITALTAEVDRATKAEESITSQLCSISTDLQGKINTASDSIEDLSTDIFGEDGLKSTLENADVNLSNALTGVISAVSADVITYTNNVSTSLVGDITSKIAELEYGGGDAGAGKFVTKVTEDNGIVSAEYDVISASVVKYTADKSVEDALNELLNGDNSVATQIDNAITGISSTIASTYLSTSVATQMSADAITSALVSADALIATAKTELSTYAKQVADAAQAAGELSAKEVHTLVDQLSAKTTTVKIGTDETITNEFFVKKVSNADYKTLVIDGEPLSNTLYIIDDEYQSAYGQQIKNVAAPSDDNDAATKAYVDGVASVANAALSAVEGTKINGVITGVTQTDHNTISVEYATLAGIQTVTDNVNAITSITQDATGKITSVAGVHVLSSATISAVTPETGYLSAYRLVVDGSAVGATINIPKDKVVESGTVVRGTMENGVFTPVAEPTVDTPYYIELTIANDAATKVYVPVPDFVDTYTAHNGTTIKVDIVSDTDGSRCISAEVKNGAIGAEHLKSDLSGVISTAVSNINTLSARIGGTDVSAQLTAAINGISSTIASTYLSASELSGKVGLSTITEISTALTGTYASKTAFETVETNYLSAVLINGVSATVDNNHKAIFANITFDCGNADD